MSAPRISLWETAIDRLSAKDRDSLPTEIEDADKPKEIHAFIEVQKDHAKGKPVKLPGGVNFFPKDALGKLATGIKRFIEVGDTAVQYDPGHAALPWAALRLILQMSINNYERHAAVLEGLEEVVRHLVWGCIIEKYYLPIPYEGYLQLEQGIISFYQHQLVFLAHVQRHLSHHNPLRAVKNTFRSDAEFRELLAEISKWQSIIESQTQQIAGKVIIKHHEESRELRKVVEGLKEPIERTETSTRAALTALELIAHNTILDWVSDVQYEKHYTEASKRALKGTGLWLFHHPEYFAWRNCSSSQILWLHGSAGSGKSTLLDTDQGDRSIVVKSLIEAHKAHQEPYPMYFYCSRTTAEPGRRDPNQILLSLLRQASSLPGGPPLSPVLQARYDEHRTAGSIDGEEATEIILQTIKDRPVTYIFVDALDECDRDTRDLLIESIEKIVMESSSLVKVFVTSRNDHPDLTFALEKYAEVRIEASDNQPDIEAYVRHGVQEAIQKRKLLPTEGVSDDLRSKIEETLCGGAQGMFRWVALQLQYLCSFRLKSALVNGLGRLPPTLHAIYQEVYKLNMESLGVPQATVTHRVLVLMLIAQRPLQTKELSQLLKQHDDDLMLPETVLDICFDFVAIDAEQDQFRFTHLSVREFLESLKDEFSEAEMHQSALSACLDIVMGPEDYDEDHYAAIYWPTHAEIWSNKSGDLSEEPRLNEFLSVNCPAFVTWNNLFHARFGRRRTRGMAVATEKLRDVVLEKPNPVLVAAAFDMQSLSTDILRNAEENSIVDFDEEAGYNALTLASRYNNLQNVETLLDRGIDINIQGGSIMQGGYYGNPLQTASKYGHVTMVDLLLNKGADVDTEDWEHMAALKCASQSGSVAVVRRLIKAGATINSDDPGDVESALIEACREGHEAVVRALLDAGADVNYVGTEGTNALYEASTSGFTTIVSLLLHMGADPQGQCSDAVSESPLMVASRHGHTAVVQLLLGDALDEPGDQFGRISLFWAAAAGRFITVEELLRTKVGRTCPRSAGAFKRTDRLGCSLIHFFAMGNCPEGMAAVLESNPHIDEPDSQGWTALHWSAWLGNANAVDFLLLNKAGKACRDTQGWTAFHVALLAGHAALAQLLRPAFAVADADVLLKADALKTRVECRSCPRDHQYRKGPSYSCQSCQSFDLCFRCVWDAHVFHPQHVFEQRR